MKQNILIFSSRITCSKQVSTFLNEHEISASFVFNTHEAMTSLTSHSPAFFWLDIDAESAEAFLKEISDKALRPPSYIILTSSFVDSNTRAIMLNQGADTCIEIPVSLSEILAVLNAVLRRGERSNRILVGDLLPCITHKKLFINPWTQEVRMCERSIVLTHTEYEILYMLASNPGVAFSRKKIYSNIWKEMGDTGTSIITDHISSLRRKLGLLPKNDDYIETVYKVLLMRLNP